MSELENQIASAAQKAVSEAVHGALNGYNSPLSAICRNVVSKHEKELTEIADKAISALIYGDAFKAALNDELEKKLARTLIERMGGELESSVNKLKANPETRARITVAISQIIKDMS